MSPPTLCHPFELNLPTESLAEAILIHLDSVLFHIKRTHRWEMETKKPGLSLQTCLQFQDFGSLCICFSCHCLGLTFLMLRCSRQPPLRADDSSLSGCLMDKTFASNTDMWSKLPPSTVADWIETSCREATGGLFSGWVIWVSQ